MYKEINMVSIEKFIDDVVEKAENCSGYKKICIDGIGQFYPEFFEDAVETCIINTAITEGTLQDMLEDLEEMFDSGL